MHSIKEVHYMKNYLLISLTLLTLGSCGSATNSGQPQPSDAKALGKELMSNLPGIFSLDEQNKVRIGGYDVPPMINGNWVLSSRPIALVDSFTSQTNAISAFLVKVDNEYVRIMTTEPNEKVGTALDHSHPAYHHLIGELRYTNKVTFAGKDYMCDYDVFRDRQGRVIGAYIVGIPMTSPTGG